jgi:hypothetical protein
MHTLPYFIDKGQTASRGGQQATTRGGQQEAASGGQQA